MTNKVKTIDLQGKEYATVPARLKEFREANPRGVIETTYEVLENGQAVFTATVQKDKKEPSSATATGHAMGDLKAPKAFEKLETISIGRALAILGYLASGDIASSEEMEEYLNYKEQQEQEAIMAATEKLQEANTIDELKTAWAEIPAQVKLKVEIVKATRKVELTEKPKEIKDRNLTAHLEKKNDN